MVNRSIVLAAAVVAATTAGSFAAQAGPQMGYSGKITQAVGSIAIQAQAQPGTTAATPTEPQPRRRFWGPILGSMERAANRNAEQAATTGGKNCQMQDVRVFDKVTRTWVTRSQEVCN